MNKTTDIALIRAKTRLTEAKAKKAEIELAVLERKKVDIEDVNSQWAEQVSRVKTKILAIPSRLAPQIVSLGYDPRVVSDLMNSVIVEALNELAEEFSG